MADDLREAAHGWWIPTPEGVDAFVPAPLPPAIAYDPALVRALSDADAALGELSGAAGALPQPVLVAAPFVMREAVLSCRIEGAQVSLRDVFASELGLGKVPAGVVRRVANVAAALNAGIEALSAQPLSQQLLGELHAIVMDGAPADRVAPGQLRDQLAWTGPAGSTLETASYVSPPPAELRRAMDDWDRYLAQPSTLPVLIQAALIVEHLDALQPFASGNGLMVRLVAPLLLAAGGRLSQPVLCLSEFFGRHRLESRDALQHVRRHGDWRHWLMLFLNGVRWSARRATRQLRLLLDAREAMRGGLASLPKAQPLADALLANPYVNPAGLRSLLEVSDPTARNIIARLVDLGVLREVTGRGWGRLWLAEALMQAIESPGEVPGD